MTSAMALAIDFGLNTTKLNRIWAMKDSQNEKAIKLIETPGFMKNIAESKKVQFELRFKNYTTKR